MLIVGNANVVARYVSVCANTVRKYWNLFLQTGIFRKTDYKKQGPVPALTPEALMYLYFLVCSQPTLQLAAYSRRLRYDLGLETSETTLCRALSRLGLHRKRPDYKKVESLAPHSRILLQRYNLQLFHWRILYGPSDYHYYVYIDEMCALQSTHSPCLLLLVGSHCNALPLASDTYALERWFAGMWIGTPQRLAARAHRMAEQLRLWCPMLAASSTGRWQPFALPASLPSSSTLALNVRAVLSLSILACASFL